MWSPELLGHTTIICYASKKDKKRVSECVSGMGEQPKAFLLLVVDQYWFWDLNNASSPFSNPWVSMWNKAVGCSWPPFPIASPVFIMNCGRSGDTYLVHKNPWLTLGQEGTSTTDAFYLPELTHSSRLKSGFVMLWETSWAGRTGNHCSPRDVHLPACLPFNSWPIVHLLPHMFSDIIGPASLTPCARTTYAIRDCTFHINLLQGVPILGRDNIVRLFIIIMCPCFKVASRRYAICVKNCPLTYHLHNIDIVSTQHRSTRPRWTLVSVYINSILISSTRFFFFNFFPHNRR